MFEARVRKNGPCENLEVQKESQKLSRNEVGQLSRDHTGRDLGTMLKILKDYSKCNGKQLKGLNQRATV